MRRDNETVSSPIVIDLRRATMEDASVLFKWRNDEDVRSVSQSSNPITMREHVKWLGARLLLTHPESVWMVTSVEEIDGTQGRSIGSARIVLDGQKFARVSVVIASDYRRRGIGRQVIKLITEKVRGMKRIAVARVHVSNLVSQRAFMACGFHIVIDDLDNSFIELQAT